MTIEARLREIATKCSLTDLLTFLRQSCLSWQLISGPDPATLSTERRKKVEKNHETEMTMTMKVPIWMYARTRVGRRQAPARGERGIDFLF